MHRFSSKLIDLPFGNDKAGALRAQPWIIVDFAPPHDPPPVLRDRFGMKYVRNGKALNQQTRKVYPSPVYHRHRSTCDEPNPS